MWFLKQIDDPAGPFREWLEVEDIDGAEIAADEWAHGSLPKRFIGPFDSPLEDAPLEEFLIGEK